MSVKIEVSEENRKFNSNWEERYFFGITMANHSVFEVASNIRSERVFLNKKTYGKYHGNSMEAFLK